MGHDAETEPVAAPDPLLELAEGLPGDDAAVDIAQLDPVDRAQLVAVAVHAARATRTAQWLERLVALRHVVLLANARAELALVLHGIADLAEALQRHATRVEALDTLIGVRELLREPWKAVAARLELASAHAAAGEPGEAEVTLMRALGKARELSRGDDQRRAAVCVADTLVRLGELLASQGRDTEAEEWLMGAIDVAPTEQSAQLARAAYERFRRS